MCVCVGVLRRAVDLGYQKSEITRSSAGIARVCCAAVLTAAISHFEGDDSWEVLFVAPDVN